MIFPQKGVRFIAINDGVDSAQGDNDFAPLRNIFNEWLVRDTSKKIRAVKKHFYTLPLYKPPRCMVQSKYGIVGLAVGNGGIYVKTDHPATHYRPLPKTVP